MRDSASNTTGFLIVADKHTAGEYENGHKKHESTTK